ncbi:DNA-binding response regulator [Lactobacillus pasteurii DSM 23907 = CRBIP 24.76]|uniref:DNA-binding response regulator n=1 Tax=Lactobacillus pasteurii DSM 23907 = CRBIP 24.76 TaxID=1423790 RepID=I7JYQ7_9LACO|nr:response regulator transcription factor [Lactobacillus pasteurii]KRK08378.1 DNA-binding response regulator [Lactobacillus pasteurii DSM 23907 = CRBIP 24.76]TDG75556.1 hypothetical protein C5L33_000441 [Lactobacillus pasteurii]CCI85765.1 DNA-binding response regulator [Lactobacillus pasteurii DSM 23907 = CRBIP 24.76]
MKILLAEDEPQLNRVITVALTSSGYDVTSVFNGQEAVDAVKENAFDVLILDIMMPVMDGVTALKTIREMGDKSYVIMLTAKAEIDDRVNGLESGADDYLTKPFSLKELIARLRSRERRSDNYSNPHMTFGDLELKADQQELLAHNSIRLTNKETDLLSYLIMNQGKSLSTEEILRHVWKNDSEADEQIVWVYISYLRQKLKSIQSKVEILGEKDGSFELIA